jgi:hypothetical protein
MQRAADPNLPGMPCQGTTTNFVVPRQTFPIGGWGAFPVPGGCSLLAACARFAHMNRAPRGADYHANNARFVCDLAKASHG